jgi:hypothetical protein
MMCWNRSPYVVQITSGASIILLLLQQQRRIPNRFTNFFSSLFYTGIHLTGDNPIIEYNWTGRFVNFFIVIAGLACSSAVTVCQLVSIGRSCCFGKQQLERRSWPVRCGPFLRLHRYGKTRFVFQQGCHCFWISRFSYSGIFGSFGYCSTDFREHSSFEQENYQIDRSSERSIIDQHKGCEVNSLFHTSNLQLSGMPKPNLIFSCTSV